jgi:hypothetical protein
MLAVSHDPDTAEEIGIMGVIIIASGEKIVDCR